MIGALRRRVQDQALIAPGREEARDLSRLIGECAAAGIGRSAIALRLSLLPRHLALPHHVRLAAAALDPLATADRVRRFELANRDIVMVWRGEADAAVASCRDAVEHLFEDEAPEAEQWQPPEGLLRLFDLPAEAADLLAIADASLHPEPSEPGAVEREAPKLDLHRLAALETELQQADMSRFARRRPVCRLPAASDPAGRLSVAWEKRFLSIEELSADLLPDHSARADPWLFRRLTRTLDRRMLALLSHPEELREARPFSINLNIASLLSPEFLRFDEALPSRLRGEVILELQPGDVMADASAFLFAREFARVRGYGLLLRGLTPILLRMFAREALGVEWLELRWSPDLPGRAEPLAGADPRHIVLGRADDAAALAWGRGAGIGHVRGRVTGSSALSRNIALGGAAASA